MASIVKIKPHVLTADTMPAEGTMIGYTGLAFHGVDYGEHGYVSCPMLVTEHTNGCASGFYGITWMSEGQADVFVMLDDDGRQMLHGYALTYVQPAAIKAMWDRVERIPGTDYEGGRHHIASDDAWQTEDDYRRAFLREEDVLGDYEDGYTFATIMSSCLRRAERIEPNL